MINKRKKENLKEDAETIIEMTPLKKERSYKMVVFVSLMLSITSLFALLTFILYFNSHYSNDVMTNEIKKLRFSYENSSQILKKEFNIKINNLNKSINELKSTKTGTNQKSISQKINDFEHRIKIIEKSFESLDTRNISTNKKNQFNDKVKISPNLEKQTTTNDIKKNLFETELKLEELLQEFKVLKNELLSKKKFSNFQNDSFLDKSIDYLSGFLNLRNFKNNDSPRSLITNAEISASEKDLNSVINYLNNLPPEWKVTVDDFIKKSKDFLENKTKEY